MTKFLNRLLQIRHPLVLVVMMLVYMSVVFSNQRMIASLKGKCAAQERTIDSLQHLVNMQEQLAAVSVTNSVNALKTISFFASMTTVQMLVEKIQNHEESLSWNAIWTATVEQYNATNPAKKLDPEKGVAEEDLKRARALEREHKRNRL